MKDEIPVGSVIATINPDELRGTPWEKWARAAYHAHCLHVGHKSCGKEKIEAWSGLALDDQRYWFWLALNVSNEVERGAEKRPSVVDASVLALAGLNLGATIAEIAFGWSRRLLPIVRPILSSAGAMAGIYIAFAAKKARVI